MSIRLEEAIFKKKVRVRRGTNISGEVMLMFLTPKGTKTVPISGEVCLTDRYSTDEIIKSNLRELIKEGYLEVV